jgi:hypothetical protein
LAKRIFCDREILNFLKIQKYMETHTHSTRSYPLNNPLNFQLTPNKAAGNSPYFYDNRDGGKDTNFFQNQRYNGHVRGSPINAHPRPHNSTQNSGNFRFFDPNLGRNSITPIKGPMKNPLLTPFSEKKTLDKSYSSKTLAENPQNLKPYPSPPNTHRYSEFSSHANIKNIPASASNTPKGSTHKNDPVDFNKNKSSNTLNARLPQYSDFNRLPNSRPESRASYIFGENNQGSKTPTINYFNTDKPKFGRSDSKNSNIGKKQNFLDNKRNSLDIGNYYKPQNNSMSGDDQSRKEESTPTYRNFSNNILKKRLGSGLNSKSLDPAAGQKDIFLKLTEPNIYKNANRDIGRKPDRMRIFENMPTGEDPGQGIDRPVDYDRHMVRNNAGGPFKPCHGYTGRLRSVVASKGVRRVVIPGRGVKFNENVTMHSVESWKEFNVDMAKISRNALRADMNACSLF